MKTRACIKKAVEGRSVLARRRRKELTCAQTRAEPMWVNSRILDMRDPHLDTVSTVAGVMHVGSVPLNLDRASARIISDLTQNKQARVPDHNSLLKILRRILFWVTALGVADSFLTLAMAAVFSPTTLAELQPNLSTRVVVYPMPCNSPCCRFCNMKVRDLNAPFLHDTFTWYNPPPPPLQRLLPPKVQAGGGGASKNIPCTGTVPIRNASTMLRVIMREGL